MKLKYICALALSLSATSIYAEKKPMSSSVDSRVQKISYNPNQITRLEVSPLMTTLVTFSNGEKIDHISVGDPDAFYAKEIGSNPNSINIKALTDETTTTNMTVMTSEHTYFFMLSTDLSVPTNKKALSLKFSYPIEELEKQNKNHDLATEEKQITRSIKNAKLDPDDYNWDYTFSGNTLILPQQVYDDGDFTYFRLRDKQSMPAFYKVNINGDLAMVDHQMRGKYVVIHDLSPQFFLKSGDEGVNVFNKKLIPSALKNKV